MHNRLFVLQVVVSHLEQWFEPCSENVIRTERVYAIDQQLFAAADEESAYYLAKGWVERGAFSDSHHDGKGDRTIIDAIGIHQLEEITSLSDFATGVQELYGVDLPGFNPADTDSDGVPTLRSKDDLEVFRMQRLRRGT